MSQIVHVHGKNCEDDLQRTESWKSCCKVAGKNIALGMSTPELALSLKSYTTLYYPSSLWVLLLSHVEWEG